MKTATWMVTGVGLATVLIACAPDVSQPTPRASKNGGQASAAQTAAAPLPATTGDLMRSLGYSQSEIDGRSDAAAPPKPKLPPADRACQDLARCCSQVKNPIEKAACLGVVTATGSGVCANALIAYQVVGGCGHKGLSLPDIFNSNGSRNTSKDCTYLEHACLDDPSQCDAAYQCNGVSPGGTDTTTTDDQCANAADQYCCLYPNEFDCLESSDPCANAPDPYCCKNPNSFDCSGSPDPCASAPDPYCCQYPNSFDCAGSPSDPGGGSGGGGSSDPCDFDPDPTCCRNPSDPSCFGGGGGGGGGSDPCDIDPESCFGF